jgi:hypothetical protein
VLDPAGYGQMPITKAISIINDGVGVAGITSSSGDGVTINAGATDSVHLRGLTIEGLGVTSPSKTASSGILPMAASISRPTSSSFSVSNTIASNNGGYGINVQPGGSTVVTGVLSKVITNNNPNGIFVAATFTGGGSLNVTIVDSEVSNNGFGINAASASGNAATAVVAAQCRRQQQQLCRTKGRLECNSSGRAFGGHGEQYWLSTFGGTIFSYGDNDIDGNTNDNTGVLTKIPTH